MLRRALFTLPVAVAALVLAPARSAHASTPYTWNVNGFTDDGNPHNITAENDDTGKFTVAFNGAILGPSSEMLTVNKVAVTFVINGTTFSASTQGSVSLMQGQSVNIQGGNASGKFSFSGKLGGGDGNYTLEIDNPAVTVGPTTYHPPSGNDILITTSSVTSISLAGDLPYDIGGMVQAWYDFTDSAGLAEEGSTFQWYRAGVPIAGATGTSYTLTQDDMNQQIKFCVVVRNQYDQGDFGQRSCMSNFIDPLGGSTPSGQVQVPLDTTWTGGVSVTLNGVLVGNYSGGGYTPAQAAENSEDDFGWVSTWPDSTKSLVVVYTYGNTPYIHYVSEGNVLTISS